MVELWIDGRRCDIDQMPTIPINFDVANLTEVEGKREGRCLELVLPATPINNALFGSSSDIYAAKRFNMEHHSACFKKEGVEIFNGTVYLIDTTIKDGYIESYSIRVNEGGAEWIESVVHSELSELDIPFAESLNLLTISSSWEGARPVRFLPVYRGSYLPHFSSSSLPAERVLLTDDYLPFISIAEMVRAMFAKSGYKVHSNFLDSELGQSLYMSGEYSRTNNLLAEAKCDFFARRAETTETTADYSGRVFASRAFAAHTVGPIVDTVDPNAIDSNGDKMSETFCRNDCFKKDSAGNICFTPKMSVKVGFLLHLEYSTEYKILSRERLCGFDTFEGLYGERVKLHLSNNCIDYRNNPDTLFQYRIVVFNHIDMRKYRLRATLSNGSIVELHSWDARSSRFVTPSTPITSLELLYNDGNNEDWATYDEDWAMYDGYIEESGMVDVEMDFRLSPRDISAGESLVLDKFWFGGAEPGMKLVLSTATSLKPYFSTIPGYNSMLEFKDIAPRNISQAELLTALGEMFNLAFYTDEVRKELYIEPLEVLYEGEREIDWRERIDHFNGVSISDSGLDLPQNTILAYINSDLASHRFNSDNDDTLGQWSFTNPLYGTKKSTKRVGNKLFTTTMNVSNVIGCAPSASIMQISDMDSESKGIEGIFTPRIVCYKGMRNLPEGESWNTSSHHNQYPYAAFVDDESINLCFEDRNDIKGLHHYHLPTLLRQRDCRRVTMSLYLTTAEIASLFTTDGSKPSLRTKFRFDIQGESQLFRLVKIGKWDTKSSVVQCVFEQELNS